MLPSQWLSQQSKIAKALIWEGGRGRPIGYANWPAARKRQLDAIYMGREKVASEPPPANLLTPGDTAEAYTRIAEDDALALYLSYVAASLGCEIDRRVPWSILDYPASALAVLFDARAMFKRREDGPLGYQFDVGKSGFVVPAAAQDSLQFLKDNGIWPAPKRLGSIPDPVLFVDPVLARRRAAYRMVEWCRNLIHSFGGFETADAELHWQYRGYAPAIRMIRQSPRAGDLAYWTGGCWGTVGFARSVLRAINIPVELRIGGTHALLWLPLEGAGLCHGDDPYYRRHRYLPDQDGETVGNRFIWDATFPVDELFVDQARFDQLFAPGLPLATLNDNTGAVRSAIVAKHLPYSLLKAHCDDLAAGTTTKVSSYFTGIYSEADLTAMKLREKIAVKLAAVGGCAAVG